MRYDDASQTTSTGHEPVARPDVDTLPAGSYGPATGNAITGAGTSSGASGADSAAGAAIVGVQGAGGQGALANGAYQATGQYGVLSIDTQGNFNYVRNPGTPDGVKDVFNYTLADASGANSSTTLTIDIGQVAAAAAGERVLNLPAGVELSDIHVNGTDLVINMPDGTQMVIPGGAVFVPQITIGDVEVPATNLAALLVNSEPQPAAGSVGEPGGNWDEPPPPLDPGVPLGDLIPPTELGYTPPTFQEIFPGEHKHPTVVIETPDNPPPGVVNAAESVDEKGLPTRNGGEPAGSGEIADGNGSNNSDGSETNTGTIVFTTDGGFSSITVDGVAITQVGQTIQGQFGVMTITGIDLNSGQITYSYTLSDNTSGDNTHDLFTVVVTDKTGDTATGTLTVNIIDDVPTARNDTDSTDLVSHVATGNVMTGADTTSGAAGADTVGADNAALSAVSSNGTGQSDSSFDASGDLVVDGTFGTLVIKADGSYTYTLHSDAPGGSVDVFTYTLTDGDGDTSQATLTITNPDHMPTVGPNLVVQLDDDALPGGNPGGPGDDPNAVNTTGTLSGSGGDGALSFGLTANGAPSGFTYQLQANGDLWVIQGSTHVLTVTVNSATGAYDVTQVAAIMHPPGDAENNVSFDISYTVTDADGDSVTGHLSINVDDDTPIATNDTDSVDLQTHLATGNVVTGVGTSSSGPDSAGADGGGHVTGLSSNNVSGHVDNDVTGGFVVVGQYGTLTMQADGSYSYAQNASVPGGVTDVFTYSYTDADGDTVTATLTITNPDHIPTIVIETPDNPAGAVNASKSVNEKGLPPRGSEPPGSGEIADHLPDNNSDTSETNTGTIVFSAQDGVASVKVDGVVIATVGQVIHGSFGDMTITSINLATGQIGYSYTLLDNTSGNNTADHFSVVVTDSDGDTATATLTVNIIDDVPTAHNDTDSTDLVTHVADGNVITGAGTDGGTSGSGVDVVGADDAQVSGLSSNNVAGHVDNDPAGGFIVAGEFGTLTLNPDGSYSYTENQGAPGGSVDVFTYTLTDGDGDTSTATLTITNPDNTPTTGENALVIVDDDDVVGAGGNAGGVGDLDPQNVTGTLSGSGGDGALTFALTADGTAPSGFTYQMNGNDLWVMQGVTHVLTITVNASTGAYSVTEVAPISHPTGADENNVNFDVGYTVTDSDGDSAAGTLPIEVNDDTPLANNDSDTIASGSLGPATGNVITGVGTNEGAANHDSPGADGFGGVVGLSSNNVAGHVDNDATGGFVVVGEFGTLTLQSDGSYSYARDAGTPGGVSDVFTYTYQDGDGDTVSATLTINIGNSVPTTGENGLVIVDDDDVVGAGGNAGGVGDLDPQNMTGTLSGSGGDGALTFALTADGTAPSGFTYQMNGNDLWVMQGVTHVLTITVNASTGAYSVTEVAPISHPTGANENNVNFDVGYTVTDSDGDSATGTLPIEVNDDTPLANNDSDTIASGTYGPATGNVITGVGTNEGAANADSPGADGFGGVVGLSSNNVAGHVDNNAAGGFVVVGQYGTLTLQSDGSYSYARDAGTPGGVSDVFTYTYKDGDGDTVSATLTIDIGNSAPTTGTNPGVIVDDDDVSGTVGNAGGTGDDAPLNTSGTLSGSGGDGPLAFALLATGTPPTGFTYQMNGNDLWVMQGANHVLTITVNAATGAYTVTEVHVIDHPVGSDENNVGFTINYQVTDQDGQTAGGTLGISVDDDTPINFTPVSHTDTTGATATTLDDSLVNDGTASVTSFINDSNNNPANGENFIGADGFGSLLFTGTAADDGTQLQDAHGTALTSHGAAILVTGYGTDTLTAYVENGAHAGFQSGEDTVVFTASLDPGAGYGAASTYTINFSDTIDNGAGVSFNDLTSSAAGNVDYRGVGADDAATTVDLLLSGTAGGAIGTVNTDSTAIGVANQSMDSGEALRIDFVGDLTSGGAGPTGFNFSGHVATNSYLGLIPQVQGSQSATVAFTVWALNSTVTQSGSPDSNPAGGFSDSSVTGITSVTVQDYLTSNTTTVNVTGFTVGVFTAVAYGISVRVNADGSVTFAGVQEGDHYGITTSGGDFNALVVQADATGTGGSTTDSFDIGTFAIGTVNSGNPIDLSLGVTATDHDGDTSTGTINLTLAADASAQQAVVQSAQTLSASSETSSTHTLTSSNDNHPTHSHDDRAFAAGRSATLMAALAAVGLEAEHSKLDLHIAAGGMHAPAMAPLHAAASIAAASVAASGAATPTHVVVAPIAPQSGHGPQAGSHLQDMSPLAHGFGHGEGSHAPTMTELLHGTAAVTHAPTVSPGPVMAPAVAMPSAQLLAAAAAAHGPQQPQTSVAGPDAQQNQVVSKVLADALHGGGNGPNIDHLLDSLSGHHGGGSSAIAALASHGGAGVSVGDMSFQMAFGSPHVVPMEEAMHVAAPAHG